MIDSADQMERPPVSGDLHSKSWSSSVWIVWRKGSALALRQLGSRSSPGL